MRCWSMLYKLNYKVGKYWEYLLTCTTHQDMLYHKLFFPWICSKLLKKYFYNLCSYRLRHWNIIDRLDCMISIYVLMGYPRMLLDMLSSTGLNKSRDRLKMLTFHMLNSSLLIQNMLRKLENIISIYGLWCFCTDHWYRKLSRCLCCTPRNRELYCKWCNYYTQSEQLQSKSGSRWRMGHKSLYLYFQTCLKGS